MLQGKKDIRVLFDGRFLNKNTFGISKDAKACFDAIKNAGALGGVLTFKDNSINSGVISENEVIQLSKTQKQLSALSLFNYKTKMNKDLNTNVFFQNQVDMIDYKFIKPHGRILRIHDLFPITNPEWFTKRAVFSFRKGISNIENGSKIFVNSQTTYNELQNYIDCSQKNVSVFIVPCPSEITKTALCQNCVFCKNSNQLKQPYLLSVGTIEPRKNYNNLLEAWQNSKNFRVYEKFVIVGRVGWKSNGTMRKINETSDVIHISECCDAGLVEIYKNARTFISASLNEGYNIPLDEASQIGLKLIISDLDVHKERFNKSQNIWITPDNIECITAALQVDPETIAVQLPRDSNFQEILLKALEKALDDV